MVEVENEESMGICIVADQTHSWSSRATSGPKIGGVYANERLSLSDGGVIILYRNWLADILYMAISWIVGAIIVELVEESGRAIVIIDQLVLTSAWRSVSKEKRRSWNALS